MSLSWTKTVILVAIRAGHRRYGSGGCEFLFKILQVRRTRARDVFFENRQPEHRALFYRILDLGNSNIWGFVGLVHPQYINLTGLLLSADILAQF